MARLLVAADLSSLAQRAAAQRLVDRLIADGHDASLATDAPVTACQDADGLVAILDGQPAPLAIAFAAVAHAQSKPVLALHTHPIPESLASLFTQTYTVTSESDFAASLPPFYAHVRPHAGKLVRDLVPRLVREAGHAVQFREATAEERPRYLKRKVSDEAAELLAAEPGAEREEVADLLEALEALIRERGYDRDDLKLVKDAKRKRRGAFERCFVVESASAVTETSAADAASVPEMLAWPSLPAAESAMAFAAPSTPTTTPVTPPTPSQAMSLPEAAPQQESMRSRLWNLGVGGKPEPIPPKRDDPERVETDLREV